MDIDKQVGELRLMSEFDLQWLPPSYLKRNTNSTEITEAWEKLPLDIRNNEEIKRYKYNLTECKYNQEKVNMGANLRVKRIRNSIKGDKQFKKISIGDSNDREKESIRKTEKGMIQSRISKVKIRKLHQQ
ncbi:hypothetical protein FQA39_LY17699 [Lamprigera yunnana]|nr:hypothetical protein FQA39_LY17699 [Lamprigera yunnana]